MSGWIRLGALLLALAVILGAFGAHGLGERLGSYEKGIYEKAVFYHFIHALGILIVGVLAAAKCLHEQSSRNISRIFCLGVFFFSGSLYALAVSGVKWLGAITPIGGTLFIIGWLYLAWNVGVVAATNQGEG